MAAALSPPKLVLLAAHFTATGDVASLASLAARHGDVLHKKLLLRLLLTYLPAHLPTDAYLPLLQSLATADFAAFGPLPDDVDTTSVQALSDAQAAKKVRKLRLQPLVRSGDDGRGQPSSRRTSPTTNGGGHLDQNDDDDDDEDPLALFLIQRAYAVDDGAGALPQLPALVAPFLDRSVRLRTWAVSVLLPLLRRNCEYYPDAPLPQTLSDFEHLPDRLAVARLLSHTGAGAGAGSREGGLRHVGRDLRGLIGPWLYSERRWVRRKDGSGSGSGSGGGGASLCPGWEEVLQWLTAQAAQAASWRVAAAALEQWDGPGDVDLGGLGAGALWLDEGEQEHLERRYARAALACAYLVPAAAAADGAGEAGGGEGNALAAAHAVVGKIAGLLDQDPIPPLPADLALLPPLASPCAALLAPRNAVYLRNDLLDEANALTAPSRAATALLRALILSAALLSRLGAAPCSVRRAGELALLQSEREQTAEAARLVRCVASNGPRSEDRYWIKARNEILWLRDWGADDDGAAAEAAAEAPQSAAGVLGRVKRAYLEVELLKALLANTRYALARALYEDAPDAPLPRELVQETVFAAAMGAYDSASNPNRTRGGLKKCDEIIHAFPQTAPPSLAAARRAEALLAATHALSGYRLVLKQGEPFTPVVLRVHRDPLSVLGTVLEQNPRSYANLQDFVSIAVHMVEADLPDGSSPEARRAASAASAPLDRPVDRRALAERRVTAMCIDAALGEDDFETAYSYVVSRLATRDDDDDEAAAAAASSAAADVWSWRAALAAGKYRRNEHTVRPTHLGTASANLSVRHLEQRIECLATALRIAPADTLHEIVSAYRRCEEELEAAVQAEDEQASAWDEAGDRAGAPPRRPRGGSGVMPGAFSDLDGTAAASASGHGLPLASRAAAAASASSAYGGPRQQQHRRQPSAAAADEAPLSLFDLSRATARAAQRNFSALSSLRQTRQLVGLVGGGGGGGGGTDSGDGAADDGDEARLLHDRDANAHVRKRDQLREAAMGTLTSGVGWLIGAQPVDRGQAGG